VLSGYAALIGEALGQQGTICFQVMSSRDEWVLTDLNLRPGAGTAMTCAAGTDLLSAHFACRWGLPYKRYLGEEDLGEEVIVTRQYAEFVM
jgi:hypothetical protein